MRKSIIAFLRNNAKKCSAKKCQTNHANVSGRNNRPFRSCSMAQTLFEDSQIR